MQCVVTDATGMYWYVSTISSKIQVSNFGYLSSAHTILTSAKMWGSVVIFEAKWGPRAEKFGKQCSNVFVNIRVQGKKSKRRQQSTRRQKFHSFTDPPAGYQVQADESVEICSMNGRDTTINILCIRWTWGYLHLFIQVKRYICHCA